MLSSGEAGRQAARVRNIGHLDLRSGMAWPEHQNLAHQGTCILEARVSGRRVHYGARIDDVYARARRSVVPASIVCLRRRARFDVLHESPVHAVDHTLAHEVIRCFY